MPAPLMYNKSFFLPVKRTPGILERGVLYACSLSPSARPPPSDLNFQNLKKRAKLLLRSHSSGDLYAAGPNSDSDRSFWRYTASLLAGKALYLMRAWLSVWIMSKRFTKTFSAMEDVWSRFGKHTVTCQRFGVTKILKGTDSNSGRADR
jgi:hypothetical protein